MQVLFAFLLVLPFQTAFATVTQLQRDLYYLAFIATTSASILLIAPTTYHRITFREPDKARMLRTSNRLFLIGMALLGLSIVSVLYLVTSVVLGDAMGMLAAAAVAVLVAYIWYGLPLLRKARDAGRRSRADGVGGDAGA